MIATKTRYTIQTYHDPPGDLLHAIQKFWRTGFYQNYVIFVQESTRWGYFCRVCKIWGFGLIAFTRREMHRQNVSVNLKFCEIKQAGWFDTATKTKLLLGLTTDHVTNNQKGKTGENSKNLIFLRADSCITRNHLTLVTLPMGREWTSSTNITSLKSHFSSAIPSSSSWRLRF